MLIAGNWKMNGLSSALDEVDALIRALRAHPAGPDVLICPPATLLERVVARAGGAVGVGGQDCYLQSSGAYTGDVSAEMLRDAGASWVIVGHSERRQYHGETDTVVAAKAKAAWRAGLSVIICIGETEAERNAGREEEVVDRQLASSVPDGATAANTAIAYEPVWAIGTGRTPTNEDIARIREPAQRQGDSGGAGSRRRAGRRREPESGGFPRHHRGIAGLTKLSHLSLTPPVATFRQKAGVAWRGSSTRLPKL
jgi:triosephosphate isomerase